MPTCSARCPEAVGARFDLIETRMLKAPWATGQDYTIADPYLFTIAQWLEADGVNLERIPQVIEHRERMLGSVQRKTSHRDRARLRPGCLGNQNRDNFKTKVTAIGAGFSITSPWRLLQERPVVNSACNASG